MRRVENLLCNIFDGGTVKVYFRFADTGKKAWARHMAVKDDPLLRAELVRILGPEHVKVQTGMRSACKINPCVLRETSIIAVPLSCGIMRRIRDC